MLSFGKIEYLFSFLSDSLFITLHKFESHSISKNNLIGRYLLKLILSWMTFAFTFQKSIKIHTPRTSQNVMYTISLAQFI